MEDTFGSKEEWEHAVLMNVEKLRRLYSQPAAEVSFPGSPVCPLNGREAGEKSVAEYVRDVEIRNKVGIYQSYAEGEKVEPEKPYAWPLYLTDAEQQYLLEQVIEEQNSKQPFDPHDYTGEIQNIQPDEDEYVKTK